MKTRNFIVLMAMLGMFTAALGQSQLPLEASPAEETTHKLPNGKTMEDEILKSDFKKAQQEAAQLVKLSQEVQEELDKNGSHVLSISLLKKLDEIEKSVKRIRSRIKK
jgi:hypothetical protein